MMVDALETFNHVADMEDEVRCAAGSWQQRKAEPAVEPRLTRQCNFRTAQMFLPPALRPRRRVSENSEGNLSTEDPSPSSRHS